ncbi:DNA polymerase-4 [Arboricoccus pini]|uniref:DNA polymerase IV n=2 Tax=Arboricoccus pini TaxID=1963835 RepID=A0A212R9K0_9PROT|nr:DNA polymerase-4 [Arboricoccus pini]
MDAPAASRKILHVDMDAFYASIEQRDDPSLRGRPLAVGGSSRRGVVLTASYEARPFGVRSAMPSVRAAELCPGLLFVKPRFDAYKEASRVIREVFALFTDKIEPLSLDEAYLDVTSPTGGPRPAVEIAREIKALILARTGLTASAGVSFNKFLAKIASDLEKPDGLTVIRPRQAQAFIASLPVARFHGVGPATARRLEALGIRTGADLQAAEEGELVKRLGRFGAFLWRIARGQDDRPVEANRRRKSLSVEETFGVDLRDPTAMRAALGPMAVELARRLERQDFIGRTLTLKIKTDDFVIRTRSRAILPRLATEQELLAGALHLLSHPDAPERPVRLLGLGVHNPVVGQTETRQLPLIFDADRG